MIEHNQRQLFKSGDYSGIVGKIEGNGVVDKFGFVLHPLSTDHFLKLKVMQLLSKTFPSLASKSETIFSKLPSYRYGKILNIQSEATGKVVQGHLYTVTDTPRMMLKGSAERMYKKLIKISKMAAKDGAKIIGLGAYTKVVGDAGVTVANNSPIPLTTGNSLSAASTLWTAEYAINKINLVPQTHNGRMAGKAMIIGATGSIGKVCAKLLAEKWTEIVIVAPRVKALEKVRKEIALTAPLCKVTVESDANNLVHECDLVLTATSARRKIVDIEKVKAGAVICDCSRPFDITKEDALKRPDVLVIAAGEVLLPGANIQINCDLGLEDKRMYACLAETALLALEGRHELFSVGRDLCHFRIKEIDYLSRKHGLRLAPLMGHDKTIHEVDYQMCREHAIERLKKIHASESIDNVVRPNFA
ncbi:MAG: hypothetical protein KAG61_11835 [Bacteriovoracaceae bacterium]|nr:hypothetical protein [Bacteriovoracaceae bacterium]